MQKVQNHWEQFERGDALVKKGERTLKEGFMLIGDAFVHLLQLNDQELIQKVRLALGLKETVQVKDICSYVSFLYPNHERYIRLIYQDEWKHVEFANTQEGGSTSAFSNFPTVPELVALSDDEFDNRKMLMHEAELKRKGKTAKEPSISEFLDLWDRISDDPSACLAAKNFRKFADLLEATHPAHGKHYCYMVSEIPAFDIDDRHDIDNIDMIAMLKDVATKEESIREAFWTNHGRTPKWGSILFNRIKDWALRNNLELPKPADPDGEYTAEEKIIILKIVHDYYRPKPKLLA